MIAHAIEITYDAVLSILSSVFVCIYGYKLYKRFCWGSERGRRVSKKVRGDMGFFGVLIGILDFDIVYYLYWCLLFKGCVDFVIILCV